MELNSKHKTCTTNLLDDLRIFFRKAQKSGFQDLTFTLADTRDIIFKHIFDSCNSSCTANRVSSECRGTKKPWVVDQILNPHLRFADDTSDRHDTTTKSFTIGHDIRCNALCLTSPHSTSTSHTSLDLIKDQRYASLITDLTNLLKVSCRRNNNTSLTLDRLKDHTCNFFTNCLKVYDCFSNIISNTVLYVLYLLYHWSIWCTVCALTTHGNSTHALSVKSTHCGDEPSSASCDTCKFQSHLNSLCTTVCEEAVLQVTRCDICKSFCQISTKRIEKLLRMKRLMIKLCFYGFQNLRISVTTGVNTKSTKTVDKFFSVQSIAVSSFILPLKNCALLRVRRNRFTVFQPARAYIVVKMIDGICHHLFFLLCWNIFHICVDQSDHSVKIFDYLFALCHNTFPLFLKIIPRSASASCVHSGKKTGAFAVFLQQMRLCISFNCFLNCLYCTPVSQCVQFLISGCL